MTNSFINLSQVTINPNSISYIDWNSTHKLQGESVKSIWVYFIVKTEDYPDAIRFDYHSQDGQILRDFFGRIEGV